MKHILSSTLSEVGAALDGTSDRLHAQRRYSVVLLDSLEYLRKKYEVAVNINLLYEGNSTSHAGGFYNSAQCSFIDTCAMLYLFKEPTSSWHGCTIELRANTTVFTERNFRKYRLIPLDQKGIIIYRKEAMPFVAAQPRHGVGPEIVDDLRTFFQKYDEGSQAIGKWYRKVELSTY